jgi:glycosyltransferase involved in cell wall biosynthesis
MIKFSIILPCYNEVESLPTILERCQNFINWSETELILVNNGSSDGTKEFFKKTLSLYKFARYINVDVNCGYGYGVIQGINAAKGKWIGWSHADLQSDPMDFAKAIEICRGFSDDDLIFVKGSRSGRSVIDRLFSRGLEFFVRFILNQKLYEINAQPNMFNRKLLKFANHSPNHWGLDLYFYFIAEKQKFKFVRIPVLFLERKSGKSKWHTGFFSRIRFSLNMLSYCFEIKRTEGK